MEWIHLPGKFADIKYMGHDMFKVKDAANKWGILSADGKVVVATEHDSITAFVENRALILQGKENRIMCIIDTDGKAVQSFKDKQIYATNYPYFKEGLLNYKDESGLYGYINTHGKVSIKAKYEMAAPFQEGIATVRYTNHYYGMIDKSGGNAIIDDNKFVFLSSPVEGRVFAMTTYRKGGCLLRIMELQGSKLKKTNHKQLEAKLFMNLSDDAKYLSCHNGHHYFIDEQWRITGANYPMELPYILKNEAPFVVESSELLSKQYVQNGVQITYKGNPILEQTFLEVVPYEKQYAIVKGKNKEYGILKLNSMAKIDFKELTEPVVFRHNPFPQQKGKDKFVIAKSALIANKSTQSNEKELENLDLSRYVAVNVGINNVDINRIKCYVNDNGHLYYAPLREHEGNYKMYLPYFREDSIWNHEIKEEIDIAMTFDGMDWMHKQMLVKSKHEEDIKVYHEKIDFSEKLINSTQERCSDLDEAYFAFGRLTKERYEELRRKQNETIAEEQNKIRKYKQCIKNLELQIEKATTFDEMFDSLSSSFDELKNGTDYETMKRIIHRYIKEIRISPVEGKLTSYWKRIYIKTANEDFNQKKIEELNGLGMEDVAITMKTDFLADVFHHKAYWDEELKYEVPFVYMDIMPRLRKETRKNRVRKPTKNHQY